MSDDRRRRMEELSRTASTARELREAGAAAAEEQQEEAPRPNRPSIFNTVQYESWIDQQIRRAQDQGAFDNLKGAGKPLAPEPG